MMYAKISCITKTNENFVEIHNLNCSEGDAIDTAEKLVRDLSEKNGYRYSIIEISNKNE